MKPLKIVILAFVLLAIALFGASYQMPLQIEVEQSIALDAAPEQVYPLLENPANWEKWSALNTTMDPSMIRLYSGPMAGAGARMQWSGDKVGTGEVTLTESISPKHLRYKQSHNGSASSALGSFILERTDGDSTLLKWKESTALKDEPIARLLGAWQKHKKEEELSKGLNRLKDLLENKTSKPGDKRSVAARNY